MMIEYIDNPPKYNVGDIVIIYGYDVLKIADFTKEEIDDWQKKAYEGPSYVGMYATLDKKYGRYKYTYTATSGQKFWEGNVLGVGVYGIAEVVNKLKKELEGVKESILEIQNITTQYFDCE